MLGFRGNAVGSVVEDLGRPGLRDRELAEEGVDMQNTAAMGKNRIEER